MCRHRQLPVQRRQVLGEAVEDAPHRVAVKEVDGGAQYALQDHIVQAARRRQAGCRQAACAKQAEQGGAAGDGGVDGDILVDGEPRELLVRPVGQPQEGGDAGHRLGDVQDQDVQPGERPAGGATVGEVGFCCHLSRRTVLRHHQRVARRLRFGISWFTRDRVCCFSCWRCLRRMLLIEASPQNGLRRRHRRWRALEHYPAAVQDDDIITGVEPLPGVCHQHPGGPLEQQAANALLHDVSCRRRIQR